MPSWINHFRIIDRLLDDIKNMDMYSFLVGTIAPDCGVRSDTPGVYIPYSGITHFTSEMVYSDKDDCDYMRVYNEFVKDENDIKKRSFYIAYLIHLYIDCIYVNELFAPIKRMTPDFRTDYAFRDIVRDERANIDFEFIANNECKSYEMFKACTPWNESYPSWYKNNEIASQMANIVRYYDNSKPADMEYKYFTPLIMDDFVDRAYNGVVELLDELDIKL